MQIVINIPDNMKVMCEWHTEGICDLAIPEINILAKAIANGTVLSKGHGKIVDLGNIDKDRIEQYNPVIYLTVNGEYIEAVSLDYLNSLQAIIEEDKEVN